MSTIGWSSWGAAALVFFSIGAGGLAAQDLGVAPPAPAVVASGSAAAAGPAGSASEATPASEAARPQYSRWHDYVHDMIGPGALIGVGVSAAIDQWQTSPAEWGTGAAGFGRRVASRGGQLVAQETVRHGLSAALGRDPEYMRCGCTDFGGRLNNALVESVTDINESGHRVFSIPRVAGSFAGGYAPLMWRPGLTFAHATRDGALGLIFNAAGNLVSEYVHLGGGRNPPVVARGHRSE